jgi:8-oxo-dGTP pyrophosphatase MutT (NUDIX family)/DNA-binding transcriptional regulator YhcF (GntR family)
MAQDTGKSLPKYRQIADDLRARIEAGEYPVDSQLPTKPELMDRYGAALGTIDSAIGLLRTLGLVETRQGAGMYVRQPPPERSEYDVVISRVDALAEEIRLLQERMRAVEQALPGEPSSVPEPQPVVAAIVTSHKGVLVARRQDSKPPWTFIAGEIEPGESPADAAVREVKEETGLQVTAGGVIGRRVHPKTKRTMVYMAATPTHGTDAFVGDEDELAEVRWVSLTEADELMGGTIFEPVHEHLRRTLPEGLR